MAEIKAEIDKSDIRQIRRDLDRIEPAVITSIGEAAEDLARVWKITGIAEAAYQTGAYVGSIKAERVNARDFIVSTDSNKEVIYSDIIEQGLKTRNYAGRYVLEKSIEKYIASDGIGERIEENLDKTLK